MAIVVITKSKSSAFVIPNISLTPDCYVGFVGAIIEPVNDPIGFIGSIFNIKTFEGNICGDCDC